MGAHLRGTAGAPVIETPLELKEGTPFVVSPDRSRLLSLWPLLAQRVSPLTGRPTLYVFEDIPDRKRSFLTGVHGAALDVREDWVQVLREEPASNHAWLLDRLRDLPSVRELPPELRLAARLLPPPGGRLVGETLGSNRLQAVVASGALGTVYAAEDAAGRQVAVKVIEVPLGPGQAERFVQEFEQLKQAQHPGIVRCYEGGIDLVGEREVPWYAMELALGGDLRSRLDERRAQAGGRAPWDDAALRAEVAEDFRAVAAAVAYLHGRNSIHRDIRPGHVLIMADGELRLSGFGLIKGLDPPATAAAAPYTSTGGVLGTPGYMAPEQERGEEVGKPADVYALGILLAELALGDRVEPDNPAGEGSALRSCRPLDHLPAGLRRFILRCTDMDPGRRWRDAGTALREFANLMNVRTEPLA
jgi:serine/threonine protein kinase